MIGISREGVGSLVGALRMLGGSVEGFCWFSREVPRFTCWIFCTIALFLTDPSIKSSLTFLR